MPKPPLEFRIDDVSLNTNESKLAAIIETLLPVGVVTLAVCPTCYTLGVGDIPEFAFHTTERCLSHPLEFAHGDRCGIPPIVDRYRGSVKVASHGMFHGDHRLLSKGAQELSIVQSCSLVQSKIFVPPWHHYNSNTEKVCRKHGIELVKWSFMTKHAKFSRFEPDKFHYYYFHTFDTGDASCVQDWLKGERGTV